MKVKYAYRDVLTLILTVGALATFGPVQAGEIEESNACGRIDGTLPVPVETFQDHESVRSPLRCEIHVSASMPMALRLGNDVNFDNRIRWDDSAEMQWIEVPFGNTVIPWKVWNNHFILNWLARPYGPGERVRARIVCEGKEIGPDIACQFNAKKHGRDGASCTWTGVLWNSEEARPEPQAGSDLREVQWASEVLEGIQ